MPIDSELLDILACPKCKGDVSLDDAGGGIICNSCKLFFPIKDGIPSMLLDEARELG
ncbi:hypothetical protein MNBD_DELTA01-1471 [hydrothermal vent metagenome]|uniref:Uncharacterized protein n=1 Tax=hydrothermal vent metagenome TaxID=652676 RepID=A0A3B0R5T0_9ZZZZ